MVIVFLYFHLLFLVQLIFVYGRIIFWENCFIRKKKRQKRQSLNEKKVNKNERERERERER